eukprot:3496697-Pyramimonas_sp.AAC.1
MREREKRLDAAGGDRSRIALRSLLRKRVEHAAVDFEGGAPRPGVDSPAVERRGTHGRMLEGWYADALVVASCA